MIGNKKSFESHFLLSSARGLSHLENHGKPFERKLIRRRFECHPDDSSSLESDRVASNPKFTRFDRNRRQNKRRRMSRHLVIRNHLWLFTNSAISCAPTDVGRPKKRPSCHFLNKSKLLFHLTDEDCSVNSYHTPEI